MEKEYMKNGIQSSSISNLATTSWLGMGDEATKETFKWITTEPPILVASSIIGRLLNDIVSHEVYDYSPNSFSLKFNES
uniref:Sesquiterpene synthase n=1 Tax=Solanum tuberosum TaxID=4113 RepID=M1C9J7_SOLTU